jgi:GTPase
MLGNVDAGKSTLVGILSSAPGTVDDGRGKVRATVFNYVHEKNNGRTSSVAHEIMGFKADGSQYVTCQTHTSKKNKIWPEIVENSAKVIHISDLCGHEKYLKTTMHGLTSSYPDYCILVIGANMGISKMTKEHIGIANALKIPVFVVFTKVDLAPAEVLKGNLEKITKILKVHCNKIPKIVRNEKEVDEVCDTVAQGKISPIFLTSNLTGEGMDVIRKFLGKLAKPQLDERAET